MPKRVAPKTLRHVQVWELPVSFTEGLCNRLDTMLHGQRIGGVYLSISAIVSRVIKAMTAHISSVSRPSAASVHAPVCLHQPCIAHVHIWTSLLCSIALQLPDEDVRSNGQNKTNIFLSLERCGVHVCLYKDMACMCAGCATHNATLHVLVHANVLRV